MNRIGRRALAVIVVLAGVSTGLHGWQTPAAPASLSVEEMERFLLKAPITKRARASKGVTDTIRATLSDGRVTHEAQIQTVNIQKDVFVAGRVSETGFKDSYRYNIGGYRLARLLGMQNVPMSVNRRVDMKDAAVTWWIDDVQFDEDGRLKHPQPLGPDPDRTSKQHSSRLVFDELIQNRDRNRGNMLWTKDWTLWLIDHTRAFRLGKELLAPEALTRCDRALLDAMRRLTFDEMQKTMGDVMTKDELTAVLIRRDLLVKHFDDRIARVGEALVLFSM
jgi:hypothetical protein